MFCLFAQEYTGSQCVNPVVNLENRAGIGDIITY